MFCAITASFWAFISADFACACWKASCVIQGVASCFTGVESLTFCTGAGVFGATGATGATAVGVPDLIACLSATVLPAICSCTFTVGATGAGVTVGVGTRGVAGVVVATGAFCTHRTCLAAST